VVLALRRLQAKADHARGVTRAELLRELRLPETTVDDRLRVLIAEGQVKKVGHGLYKVKPLATEWRFPNGGPPGTKAQMLDPLGRPIEIRWLDQTFR
jgi:hypothetical protein